MTSPQAAMLEMVSLIARLDHESELEDGMSGDDAVDTLNSLITWARSLVGAAAGGAA